MLQIPKIEIGASSIIQKRIQEEDTSSKLWKPNTRDIVFNTGINSFDDQSGYECSRIIICRRE